jgi:uncharacterized hydrophobic protein (TIGR00341 family)
MKKILVHVRAEERRQVEQTLHGLYYVISQVGDVYEIDIYTPDNELDELVDRLRNALDLRYNENMIEVSSPNFVISSYLKRAERRAEETVEKTPVEELVYTTAQYAKLDRDKLVLTSIAGLIALSGLFLDNSAIIIGAMLLSPIIGPIYAFAVFAALGKIRDSLLSVTVFAELLVSVFALSALTTFLISLFVPLSLTSEIVSRIVANPIYLLMPVLLGFAAVLAFNRGTSEVIAGVAIAAAIIPPTVVTGIVLVLQPLSLATSALLVIQQVIGLMAGALVAVVVLKIGPRETRDKIAATTYMRWSAAMIVVLFILLLVISILLQGS